MNEPIPDIAVICVLIMGVLLAVMGMVFRLMRIKRGFEKMREEIEAGRVNADELYGAAPAADPAAAAGDKEGTGSSPARS